MKLVKIFSALGLVAMSAAIISAFSVGNFSEEGSRLLAMPWGIVSMIDLYSGFILFSIWIVYREKSKPAAMLWVVLMMLLGFWTGSLYMLLAAFKSRGDWRRFWMGDRA
jgi:hypothetical protein